MHRNSLSEISGRVMHTTTRLTLNKANSNPMMMELDSDFMNSEGRKGIEFIQGFGLTATPLGRDESQQQQGQQQGSSDPMGTGEQAKGPAAEGIALFLGGQRNHPVVIAVDDRRHRPMGLKPGESAQYDDQGQMTLLRRDGLYMVSLDDEQQQSGASGSQSQSKERFVSMRHVQKQKQQRGSGTSTGSGNGSSAPTVNPLADSQSQQQQTNHEDFKHEGETVNTEIRCSKNRIEFRVGDETVGYYDKQSKRWSFSGEMRLGSDSASHPVYGVGAAGKGMTTQTSGAGAVLVNAPNPGPPTSLDTEV